MDKDGDGGKNELEKDEAPPFFLNGNACRKCVESPGVDMRHKDTCRVDDTEMFRCMEEYGVVAKATNMKVDPKNHTRWKHTWGWHNRGCVWDKIASEWSGKDVNTIHPEPEIHEHFMIQKGYGTLCTT